MAGALQNVSFEELGVIGLDKDVEIYRLRSTVITLSQQIDQAREDVGARDGAVEELRTRLTEEKTKNGQLLDQIEELVEQLADAQKGETQEAGAAENGTSD